MTAQTWGVILAALFALIAAVYTAIKNNESNRQTGTVAEAASQREFQLAFLKTLQDEIGKLNAQRDSLRIQLTAIENDVDLERSRRRVVESKFEELIETVERLQNILKLIPTALENPEVQRFVQSQFNA